jgi:hypothetical protein
MIPNRYVGTGMCCAHIESPPEKNDLLKYAYQKNFTVEPSPQAEDMP